MKKVIVRAPMRADLAGGTLDLWPLHLFHPGGRTVNVAIAYHAEAEVADSGDDAFDVHLTDQQYHKRYDSLTQLGADPKVALVHRLVEHFHLRGLRILTRTDAPRGSGLGGSSALAIALARALSELAGHPLDGADLIALVRDLETRLLGVPAGIQDYYPPVYGGLAAIHLEPGLVTRNPISLPLADVAAHMLLHYTGIAHFSGTNNWELYKRQIDGDAKVRQGFSRIAATSIEMEKALERADFETAGAALAQEWENRKALIDGISTPEVDAAIAAGRGAGAWGGKVCGAGGGGCVVFLFPPDKREAIVHALASVPGRVIDAAPVAHGLTLEITDDTQSAFGFARGRVAGRSVAQLEQLYVSGGTTGDYKPFVLAEGAVTHSEPRSGLHRTTIKTWIVPIDPTDGRVQWNRAAPLDPERLDIRAVPDPRHKMDIVATPEALMQGAVRSEESFRQFLEETARMQLLHNPAFNLYSEVNETRESFIERCMEEARRQLDDEAERLESTFRRRIDQLRERSEREQREIDANDDGMNQDGSSDVNVAWGQALYNITSGKPATTETGHSLRESDYIENIAQIQRAWTRELESRREELTTQARSIEESTIIPTARNIEVTRFLILWSSEDLVRA